MGATVLHMFILITVLSAIVLRIDERTVSQLITRDSRVEERISQVEVVGLAGRNPGDPPAS